MRMVTIALRDLYICACTYVHVFMYIYTIHICIYVSAYMQMAQCKCGHEYQHSTRHTHVGRSRRRSDFKYLDLEIYRFSRQIFWATGTPFTQLKKYLEFQGLSWKRIWCVWGLKRKLVRFFGSRHYWKSDLLRLWVTSISREIHMWMSWLTHEHVDGATRTWSRARVLYETYTCAVRDWPLRRRSHVCT